jgi:hypothetical protein
MHNEVQDIISGKVKVRYGANINAVVSFLTGSTPSGGVDKNSKQFKRAETQRLRRYITDNNLWVNVDINNYVSEGAEQKVYLKSGKSVLKLNDAIYYLSWIDYFHNLLLNNYLFPDTAYQLLGFYEDDNVLYAVVEQAFIQATEKTDLTNVCQFMQANGFERVRTNDYYSSELGILIEDLHDENVLTNNGILYFIDTVIYIQ